jgi:hypothetical protein
VPVLLSHVDDGAVEATWPWRDVDVESCRRQCGRVMLAMALPRQLGHSAM